MIRNRIDHQIIADLIPPNSSVLDLGCGNGELMQLLIKTKNAQVVGLEKDIVMVNECLAKGLPVIQANLDQDLSDYETQSFDYVILSLTLQALKKTEMVLKEMLRIGKKAIVSFPNFGHYGIRFYLLFYGKMPKSKFFPYEWYNTPNIHFCSIRDFEEFTQALNIQITKRIYLKNFNKKMRGFFPNLFASIGIFVLENRCK